MTSTILITALVLSAPALKDPPAKGPKVTGTWILESQISNGQPLAAPAARRYTFTDDGLWVMWSGNLKAVPKPTRPFRLEGTKNPAVIDMHLSAAAGATVYYGIAKQEGDTLTICYSREPDNRPAKFESAVNSKHYLLILKRAPKE